MQKGQRTYEDLQSEINMLEIERDGLVNVFLYNFVEIKITTVILIISKKLDHEGLVDECSKADINGAQNASKLQEMRSETNRLANE